jgi:hypothetical protein
VLTFGFLRHHASASVAVLVPSLSAIAVSFRTFSIWAWPSGDCNDLMVSAKNSLLVVKRESCGMPSLYLPVRMPEARGDQMVVP